MSEGVATENSASNNIIDFFYPPIGIIMLNQKDWKYAHIGDYQILMREVKP